MESDVFGAGGPRAGAGLDFSTIMTGLMRGLAAAHQPDRVGETGGARDGSSSPSVGQSDPSPDASATHQTGNINDGFRRGTAQFGPLNVTWGIGSRFGGATQRVDGSAGHNSGQTPSLHE